MIHKYEIQALSTAIAEAKRFIAKAEAAKSRLQQNENAALGESVGSTKEMGAAKRASMDLTRALVKVRRPLE